MDQTCRCGVRCHRWRIGSCPVSLAFLWWFGHWDAIRSLLAVFAGVPQLGAVAATCLPTAFLSCNDLTAHTSALFEASAFSASTFCANWLRSGSRSFIRGRRGRPGPRSKFRASMRPSHPRSGTSRGS